MTQTAAYSPDERQDLILQLLHREGRLAVAELAELFSTSDDSIRRDLRQLASSGRIRRVHGAVLPVAEPVLPFDARDQSQSTAKAEIAAAVLPFLAPGTTLLIDGGTTTLAIARALPADFAATVITNSPPVALALADHRLIDIILVGGRFERASRTTLGSATNQALRGFRADLCLLGLCSLDLVAGITAHGYDEAETKRVMIEQSASIIAVSSAEKLNRVSPFFVAPVTVLDRLITDRATPADILRPYEAAGVPVSQLQSERS